MGKLLTIQLTKANERPENRVFGKKIGLIGRMFGCFHRNLSRPFTRDEVSYRSCLECGARKRFDTDSLRTFRTFYYPPESNA